MVALLVGGVLSLVALAGVFFWTAVPQFGFVRSAEQVASVRYTGDFNQVLDEPGYLKNYVGYRVTVETATGSTAGTVADVTDGEVVLATAGGESRIALTDVVSATVTGSEYTRPDWGQKIFYFHVPVAEISLLMFSVAAFFGIRFLMTRRREFDVKAHTAMEVTLFFIILTMATGMLWTKSAWGVWWEWEPRLTTYFIMTLLVIAYFVLRNAVDDEERRALYAAAFSILAFIDAPISFFVTRLVPSTHPVIEKGGLEGSMLVVFIIAQVGMLLFGYAVYELRMGEVTLRDRIEIAKIRLEG